MTIATVFTFSFSLSFIFKIRSLTLCFFSLLWHISSRCPNSL